VILRANTVRAERKLAALKHALTPAGVDKVVAKVAWQTFAHVVQETPKRWFGQVRSA